MFTRHPKSSHQCSRLRDLTNISRVGYRNAGIIGIVPQTHPVPDSSVAALSMAAGLVTPLRPVPHAQPALDHHVAASRKAAEALLRAVRPAPPTVDHFLRAPRVLARLLLLLAPVSHAETVRAALVRAAGVTARRWRWGPFFSPNELFFIWTKSAFA